MTRGRLKNYRKLLIACQVINLAHTGSFFPDQSLLHEPWNTAIQRRMKPWCENMVCGPDNVVWWAWCVLAESSYLFPYLHFTLFSTDIHMIYIMILCIKHGDIENMISHYLVVCACEGEMRGWCMKGMICQNFKPSNLFLTKLYLASFWIYMWLSNRI